MTFPANYSLAMPKKKISDVHNVSSIIDNVVKTDDILKDMRGIIETSQKAAYQSVNTTFVQRDVVMVALCSIIAGE